MNVHMQGLATTVAVMGIATLAAGEPVSALHLPSPMTLHAERAPDLAASLGASRLAVDPAVLANVRPGDHVFLYDFPLADNYTVTLQLEAFSAVSRDARFVEVVLDRRGRPVEIQHPWPTVHTLMGHVVGEPDSRVYLAIGDRLANGRIAVDGTRFVVGTSVSDGLTLVYDEANVPVGFFPEAPWTCDVSTSSGDDGVIKDPGADRNLHGCPVVRIAIDTDVEYSELFGGDATAACEYAITLLGDISSIYIEALSIQLIASYFRAWNAPDPWTMTTAGAQLRQFGGYWNRYMGNVQRGLAHLFCGRHLGGGVAWLSVVCAQGQGEWGGYAVSSGFSGSYPMPLETRNAGNGDPALFAHENGHNFGMVHTHDLPDPPDQCGNGDCSEAEGATIMSYCGGCAGGVANIEMEYDDDNIDLATAHLQGVICDLWTDGGPPTVLDDSATCEYDGMVDVFVLANDFANDCSDLMIFKYDEVSNRGGTVDLVLADTPAGPTVALRYYAPGNIIGLDVFTYGVRDGSGNEERGTVIINVLRPPPPDDDDSGFDPGDLIRIITVWGDRSSDWNGDGTVDGKDLDALLSGEPKQPRR